MPRKILKQILINNNTISLLKEKHFIWFKF